jgi:glycerol-3-phosphate dehydrogenase
MRRDPAQLADREFDVVVVGGGVYGLCAAWDAALRGLSVALIERADFGGATSGNSLRIIHGGLRYLQHADLRRMRESICDRRLFLRIAPHLVHPLPFFIPTYGRGLRGRGAFAAALALADLVGRDRNRGVDADRRLPAGRVVSRADCLRRFPALEAADLTGAAIYYDCQMSSSERLIVSIARAAADAGAALANYVEAVGFLARDGRVSGVRARDVLADAAFEIRARVVLNAAGPWVDRVLDLLGPAPRRPRVALSRAFNVEVDRPLSQGFALGVYGRRSFDDRDALLNKGSRLLFLTPSATGSMIGTVHLPHAGSPDASEVAEAELLAFLREVNEAYPAAAVRREDVRRCHSGLLPMKPRSSASADVQLEKRYALRDHAREGVEGLISLVGVKFTEAPRVAARAVGLALGRLGRRRGRTGLGRTAVHGGRIARFEEFVSAETRARAAQVEARLMRDLISCYGAAYAEVLECLPRGAAADAGTIAAAQVRHAVRREMAQRLEDVVLRRGLLGTPPGGGRRRWAACAALMAEELGWTPARTERELERVDVALAGTA